MKDRRLPLPGDRRSAPDLPAQFEHRRAREGFIGRPLRGRPQRYRRRDAAVHVDKEGAEIGRSRSVGRLERKGVIRGADLARAGNVLPIERRSARDEDVTLPAVGDVGQIEDRIRRPARSRICRHVGAAVRAEPHVGDAGCRAGARGASGAIRQVRPEARAPPPARRRTWPRRPRRTTF